MRLLDEITDKKLDRVVLHLTRSEARELLDSLKQLLDKPDVNHAHIPSEDYRKEISVCIYDDENLEGFSQRAKRLILEDK